MKIYYKIWSETLNNGHVAWFGEVRSWSLCPDTNVWFWYSPVESDIWGNCKPLGTTRDEAEKACREHAAMVSNRRKSYYANCIAGKSKPEKFAVEIE